MKLWTMPIIELSFFLYYYKNVRIKKYTLFIFVLLMMISLLSYGLCQESSESEKVKKEPLSEWSKQWLEEVVLYIISPEEKEVFKNLPNEEERGKFIINFWRVRDPNPSTPKNEFKIEYYRRIAMANKFFASAIPGWRTDRGRIYILLGPPNEIQQDFNPSADQSLTTTHAAKEVWSYMGLPGKKLPYSLEITFVDKYGTGNYVLASNLGLLGGAENIDLNSMHYHFDYMENLAEVMKTPYESLKELEGIITTQVTYDLIPLNYNLYYLKGSEENTYIPLIIEIPYSKLPYKEIEGKYYFSLTLIVNVSNKLGQITHRRSKNSDFNYSPAELESLDDRAFQIQAFLSLEPEAYKIHLLVLDNFSGKIGTLHQDISVPQFRKDELVLSDIIISHKEYEPDSKFSGSRRASLERVFSEVNKVFSPDHQLNLYFEIYSLATNPKGGLNDFAIEYSFFHDKDLITHVPATKSDPTAQKDCRVQTSFKLKNFKPGRYTLQVRVTDRVSEKSATRDISFIVTD